MDIYPAQFAPAIKVEWADAYDDAEEAMDAAEQAASKVETVLRARLGDPSVIRLRSCTALCESDVTIAQSRLLTQWRLEYMTLSADEEQPGKPVH